MGDLRLCRERRYCIASFKLAAISKYCVDWKARKDRLIYHKPVKSGEVLIKSVVIG
jgi:hypothetical protein